MKARPGFVTALVLIALGVVMLLNNFGVVQIGLVDLVNLWPILLILFAIELLVSRTGSNVVYALGMVWAAVVLVAGVGLAWTASQARSPEVEAAAPRFPLTEPMGDANSADIQFELDTGTLEIGAAEAPGALVEAVGVGKGAQLNAARSDTGGRASVSLAAAQGEDSWAGLTRFPNDVRWEVGLADSVPLALAIGLGAVRARIDASDLMIERLDLGMSVGDLTFTLPRTGRMDARLRGGAGTVTIEIPPGTPARILVPPRLTDVDVGAGFETWGSGAFQTRGLDDSGPFHTVEVALTVGRVEIR